jgi:hypothetical protein
VPSSRDMKSSSDVVGPLFGSLCWLGNAYRHDEEVILVSDAVDIHTPSTIRR